MTNSIVFFFPNYFQHHEVNVKNVIEEEQNRTKVIIQKIIPDLPPGPVQYEKWLEHLENYFKNKVNVLNHSSMSNNCNSNSSQTTNNSTDESAIEQQNIKLQKSLDSCKIVMSETVSKTFFIFPFFYYFLIHSVCNCQQIWHQETQQGSL